MVAIPSRHRSLVLLAVVVVAQILLLAVQIRRERQGRLIRVWTVAVISPFERAGSWGAQKIRGTWNNYFALRGATRENQQLRKDIDDLKIQVSTLQSRAREGDRLAALLHFRQAHADVPMLPARVIGGSADAASQTIYIDRGERDGVRRNMGVITPDGVAGKVVETFRDVSQVLLITDKDSGVDTLLADSRIQSPVRGMGEPLLDMKYVMSEETVNVGDHAVTSGMDRIFPKDLSVGTIVSVETQKGNAFKIVRVRPAAQLNRLEEVIVLLSLRPLELKKETQPATGTGPVKGEPAGAPKP